MMLKEIVYLNLKVQNVNRIINHNISGNINENNKKIVSLNRL